MIVVSPHINYYDTSVICGVLRNCGNEENKNEGSADYPQRLTYKRQYEIYSACPP